MIIVDKKHIAGIPLLEVVPIELKDKALPAVFFIHGFNSAKEHNLHYAYLMAEQNIRVILPEVKFHGERRENVNIKAIALKFWEIIIESIIELNTLKKEYVSQEKILEDKIGVAGTSMGGIITLGALTQYDWIHSAVSLMGNPQYESFAQYLVNQLKEQGFTIPFTDEQLQLEFEKLLPFDLSKQPEKLQKRPLLFWHGKKDPIVPFNYAYSFYENIKEYYKDFPERLHFIADEAADHKVSRDGLLATVDWFAKFLR